MAGFRPKFPAKASPLPADWNSRKRSSDGIAARPNGAISRQVSRFLEKSFPLTSGTRNHFAERMSALGVARYPPGRPLGVFRHSLMAVHTLRLPEDGMAMAGDFAR